MPLGTVRLPYPPPLAQTPGHLTFLKNFGQIPRYVVCLDRQMPHPLELQRGSNPPPSRHVKATVQNLFPCVKPFIQMFIFCNKQLAAVWFNICVTCNFNDNRVICNIKTQLKYPSSLKDILQRFLRQGLISLKMLFLESPHVIFRKPHSMGFFKGSQMLQQNCEHIK